MKKNSKKFLYALDIGSKKMTLAAAAIEGNRTFGPVLIETQESRGIFKGVVNDLAALSDAIQQLFKKMEANTSVKASRVALSINGNYINARNSSAALAIAEHGMRSITRRDIDRLNSQARTLGLELDETLLHEFPQGYSIERHNTTLNPLGLHGRRFEGNLLLLCAKGVYIENITKAVERCGVDVVRIVFSGVAASAAVMTQEEKQNGAILIDIGDALTTVLMFKDGVVRKTNVLSFGGKNLSEIISNYCKIPIDLAYEIKESSLEINREIPETEEIMVRAEDGFRPVRKKELISVIAPEIDKFIAMLKSVIFENGSGSTAAAKIIVTGGVSVLEGLLEKMEHDLGLPVKMGIAKGLGNIPATKAPAYASAIGLLYLQRDALQKDAVLLGSEGRNKLAKVIDYITNLYQDYF